MACHGMLWPGDFVAQPFEVAPHPFRLLALDGDLSFLNKAAAAESHASIARKILNFPR